MSDTTNYGLKKPGDNDYYDVNILDANMDVIDTALADNAKMIPAGGAGTAITISAPSITAYKAYQKITFIAPADNSGAATTIKVNSLAALPLYKPNTTAAPTLKAGKAYDVWVGNAADRFFLKASAEGTATAAQVLANVPFSNESDTGILGTMPNNGSIGTQNLTTEGAEYTISEGYHNGLGKVKAVIANIAAAVIKAGSTVGGIAGTFTADATAATTQILSGVTAYVNGNKITGTMANNATPTATITNQNGTITVPAGYNPGGVITATLSNLVAGVIKLGAVVGGITGTFNNGVTASSNVVIVPRVGGGNYTSTTNVLVSRITFGFGGTVRLDFMVGNYGYGQIFINDVAVGTLRYTGSTANTYYTEDFNISPGDVVKLYIRASSGSTATSDGLRACATTALYTSGTS